MPDPVLFYDGECNLCHGAVQFILKHEKEDHPAPMYFCPLQSKTAKELLAENYDPSISYFMVKAEGKVLKKSDAALYTAGYLGGGYNLLKAGRVLPKFLRDWAYDIVAKYRYKVFGKKDSCLVPTNPAWQGRFLT